MRPPLSIGEPEDEGFVAVKWRAEIQAVDAGCWKSELAEPEESAQAAVVTSTQLPERRERKFTRAPLTASHVFLAEHVKPGDSSRQCAGVAAHITPHRLRSGLQHC